MEKTFNFYLNVLSAHEFDSLTTKLTTCIQKQQIHALKDEQFNPFRPRAHNFSPFLRGKIIISRCQAVARSTSLSLSLYPEKKIMKISAIFFLLLGNGFPEVAPGQIRGDHHNIGGFIRERHHYHRAKEVSISLCMLIVRLKFKEKEAEKKI